MYWAESEIRPNHHSHEIVKSSAKVTAIVDGHLYRSKTKGGVKGCVSNRFKSII